MFGYNAGGGAYLPRQGSFVIQAGDTFIGLTGPGVVKSVLGEDVSAEDLGGPGVHGLNGVADLTTDDELGALRTAIRLLSYLPNHNAEFAPFRDDVRSDRPLHGRGGHPVPAHVPPAGRHELAARHHAVRAADLRPRRVLRAAARARAQPDHRVRPDRRPRGRDRREQLRGRVGPDRHRRRAQGHALHPLLQPLQHPADLPRGHDRLPARPRAGGRRHHPRGPPLPRLDHRRARAVDDADHPQRVRRRVRELQLALRRRGHGVHDADGADRGDGARGQGLRLQGRDPRARRGLPQGDRGRHVEGGGRRARATRGSPRSPRATRPS